MDPSRQKQQQLGAGPHFFVTPHHETMSHVIHDHKHKGPGYLSSTQCSRSRQSRPPNSRRGWTPIPIAATPDPEVTWNLPPGTTPYRVSRMVVLQAPEVARVLKTVGLPISTPPGVPCALPPGVHPDQVLDGSSDRYSNHSGNGSPAPPPMTVKLFRPRAPSSASVTSSVAITDLGTISAPSPPRITPTGFRSTLLPGKPAHGGSRGRGGSRLGSAVARPPSLRPGSSNGPDTAALLGAIAAFAEPSPEEFERLRQTEREIMHEKSRNWTSTWTGTLQGQRTQALVAHEVRQASDEAQRCAADELHASEMAKQRASAVQRARDMQLAGTEEARNVAYEVRKAAVMEERDRQVQFKHSGYAAAAGLADISDAAGATKSKIALTAIGESAEPIVIVGPAGRDLAAQLATARETAAAARRQEIEADRAVAEADARARDEADAHRAATDRESKRIQRAALDAQTSHRTRLQGQLQAEEREIEQAGAQWTACKLSLAQKVAAIEVERRGTRMSVAEQLGTQSARKAQEVREKAEITLAATVKKREEDMAERNRQEAERRTGAARDLKNYFDHHVERQRLFKEQSARESQQTRTQLITDADADKHERELRALERKLEAMELAKAHREQISYKESRERELVREEHEKAKRAIPNPVQAYSEEEMSSFMGRHFLELQQGTPLVGLPLPKPPASAGGSRVVMEAGSAEAAALRLAVPTPPPFRAAVIKPVSKDSVTQPAANVKPPWMRSVAARRGGKRGGARI